MSTQCSKAFRFIFIVLFLIIFSRIKRVNAEFDFELGGQQRIACSQHLTRALNTICRNVFNKRFKRCPGEFGAAPEVETSGQDMLSRLIKKLQNGQHDPGLIMNAEKLKGDKGDAGDINYWEKKGDNKVKQFVRKQRGLNYVVERGVADECCIQGCVYDDLLKYCE